MMLKHTLLFALVGVAGARRSSGPFLPPKALSVRGGAGPLDATDTAKLATALVGVQGALSVMSPSSTAEAYGVNSSPLLDFMTERSGLTLLSFALTAYQLIFKDADLKTAVGISTIPWILGLVKFFWNKDNEKLDMSAGPSAVVVAIVGAVAYACFTDNYADTAIKAVSIWNIVNGAALAVAPDKAAELWGGPEEGEGEEGLTAACRSIGYITAGLGIYHACLAWGVDPTNSFGYAFIPALIMQIQANFFSEDEFTKGPALAWLLLDAIVVVTCGVSLGGKGGESAPAS